MNERLEAYHRALTAIFLQFNDLDAFQRTVAMVVQVKLSIAEAETRFPGITSEIILAAEKQLGDFQAQEIGADLTALLKGRNT